MQTKLTLKIEEDVIQQAKSYAARQNRSLSALVENYLRSLTVKDPDSDTEEIKISPFIQKMTADIALPEDLDTKEAYTRFLQEKYQ